MKVKLCLILSSLIALAAFLFFINTDSYTTSATAKPILKFSNTGTFKIVQFADIQDGPNTDTRTLTLMGKVLDKEKPNLVILTGDNIDGRCKDAFEVRKAIFNIARPMELRRIPWAVIFGNHDEDHRVMSKEEMMKFYMSFSHNLSQIGLKTSGRVGNYNLLVQGSMITAPMLNIYLLDSGESTEGNGYDSITDTQVQWYSNTANYLKSIYNREIPALMFFHIPLPEFNTAYNTGYIDGVRLESESSPAINTGLFNTLVKTGDVKGVFVGHDHLNTYTAFLNGIKLGYAGNTGYGTYGSTALQRGARVFEIKESNPSAFSTRMVFAGDVGASTTN